MSLLDPGKLLLRDDYINITQHWLKPETGDYAKCLLSTLDTVVLIQISHLRYTRQDGMDVVILL